MNRMDEINNRMKARIKTLEGLGSDLAELQGEAMKHVKTGEDKALIEKAHAMADSGDITGLMGLLKRVKPPQNKDKFTGNPLNNK